MQNAFWHGLCDSGAANRSNIGHNEVISVFNNGIEEREARMTRDNDNGVSDNPTGHGSALLYGGIAAGVLLGAAVSTYLWRQRARALDLLNMSPLERAEHMIANCESKLEAIERSFADLEGAR